MGDRVFPAKVETAEAGVIAYEIGEGRMKKVIAMLAILSALLVLSVCNFDYKIGTGRMEDSASNQDITVTAVVDDLELSMTVPSQIHVGEAVVHEFSLKNIGNSNITVEFGSTQVWDITIRTSYSAYNWSSGRLFLYMVGYETLDPQQSFNGTITWDYSYADTELLPQSGKAWIRAVMVGRWPQPMYTNRGMWTEELEIELEPPAATVSISPSEKEVSVGQNFTVSVDVANVIDLYSLQLRIVWNATILNVTDAAEGEFLSGEGSHTFFFKEVSAPTEGLFSMYIGCTLLGDVSGVSGSGTLASIEFLATAPGETFLDISETSYEEIDGAVTVIGPQMYSEESAHGIGLASLPARMTADPLWTVRNPLGGPNDFPSIQAAIDSPSVAGGDTIHVFFGVDGPIIVTKALTIIGQGMVGTIINGGGATAVTIRADNVLITEFTIRNGYAGVFCGLRSRLTIINNDITSNVVGVVLFRSPDDTLIDNKITNNACGILLWGPQNVMVRANDILTNGAVGVQLLLPISGNIYYNDFVNNLIHVFPNGGGAPQVVWDDNTGKGNYWATPPPACPADRWPLTGPWVAIPEDVNRDGRVNIIDISLAARAFGSAWSNPRWNPKADVDFNRVINILDISRIAILFGWTDP